MVGKLLLLALPYLSEIDELTNSKERKHCVPTTTAHVGHLWSVS